MGTSQVALDVVYDTGSDWVVVEGKTCGNCEGNTYDPSTSTASKQIGTKISKRNYGTASLWGTEYTDKVCINSNKGCVNNFQYF
jgi:hypothetical protein